MPKNWCFCDFGHFKSSLISRQNLKLQMDVKIEDFKLSAELTGHSLDVRSVAYANNCIVSGSRDKTSRIWERLDDG